jgi:hypothetical protein
MPVNPTVDDVVAGWIRHFYAADQAMEWRHAERELSTELAPGVILAGRMDADGVSSNEGFFGEWKSSNPRNRNGWREKWRFHPQTLTYGLLMRELAIANGEPPMRRFTIRMAFKGNPPTYDHEWFEYSDGELDTWRGEVLRIASAIRAYEASGAEHWALNPSNCHRWGPNYPCPFLHNCTHQTWDTPSTKCVPRVPHLQLERDLVGLDAPLILDATRIDEYLGCPESFRRQYIRPNEVEPPSEALTFGQEFHQLLGEYYDRRAKGESFDAQGVTQTWPNH